VTALATVMAAMLFLPAAGTALPFEDPELVSATGYESGLGVARDGSAVIAWEDKTDDKAANRIYARTYAPDGSAGEPVLLDEDTGVRPLPFVETAPDGISTVFWAAHRTNRLRSAQIAPDGTVTTLPDLELAGVIDDPGSWMHVHASPGGAIDVLWQEQFDEHEVHVMKAASLLPDGTWAATHELLGGENHLAMEARLLPAADGGSMAVWTESDENDEVQLRSARLFPDGSIGEVQVLAEDAGSYRDRRGELATAGNRVFFARNDVKNRAHDNVELRMLTLGDDGAAVGDVEVIDSAGTGQGGFYGMDAAVDESGLATLAWSNRSEERYWPRPRIEALQVGADGSVDRLGPISRKDRSVNTWPQVTAGASARAEIVWMREKQRSDRDSRQLAAARIRAGEGVTWRQRFAGSEDVADVYVLEAAADATGRVRLILDTDKGLVTYVSR
jgi:hypothetical protein